MAGQRGILSDAQNMDNAKLFLNLLMDPENAGMISNYTGYPNGITGSEAFMTTELLASPEMTIPAEVQDLYSRIWIDLTK